MKISSGMLEKLLTILLAAFLSGCSAGSEKADPGVNEHAASKLIPASGSSGTKEHGRITGVVDASLLNHSFCSEGKAVYIFRGDNVIPDDVGGISADPVAFASIEFDTSSNSYRYRITYLRTGNYTLAFTCQAREDNPEIDDDISFLSTSNVTVLAGEEISKHLF